MIPNCIVSLCLYLSISVSPPSLCVCVHVRVRVHVCVRGVMNILIADLAVWTFRDQKSKYI